MRTARTYHNPDRPDKSTLSPDELPAPSTAIRCFCLECVGWNAADVRRCTGNLAHGKCHLWEHRMGGKRGLSPGTVIRKECLRCMGGSREGVRECPDSRCPLWPYRFGANPRTNRRARASFEAGKARQAGVDAENGSTQSIAGE